MLRADQRLRTADDFGTTVRRGIRIGRPLVVVHATAAPHDEATVSSGSSETGHHHGVTGPARVGFVVSRSVGSAVVRNTVRRRLRHLMRERIDRLPAGARVVVRARPEAAHAPSTALGHDLDSAFDRLDHRMAAR